MNYTTSAVSKEVLWNLLRQHGLSEDNLTQTLGIDPSLLLLPDKHISLAKYLGLWALAIEVTGDAALGLHLRDHYSQVQSHFVTSLFNSSPTLLEGLHQWIRFHSLLSNADYFELRETGDELQLVYKNLSPLVNTPWIPEFYFSMVNMQFQRATGMPDLAEEVRMAHPAPSYANEYQKVFSTVLKFDQSEYLIGWKRENLNTALLSSDPYYHSILRKYADDAIQLQNEQQSFSGKIRQTIVALLPSNEADITHVASAYHMDRRTLLRKLKLEKTTFKALLEETRKQLAHIYLMQGLSITQTSYLLGFTATTSFQTAFKRWYSQSTGTYRLLQEISKDADHKKGL